MKLAASALLQHELASHVASPAERLPALTVPPHQGRDTGTHAARDDYVTRGSGWQTSVPALPGGMRHLARAIRQRLGPDRHRLEQDRVPRIHATPSRRAGTLPVSIAPRAVHSSPASEIPARPGSRAPPRIRLRRRDGAATVLAASRLATSSRTIGMTCRPISMASASGPDNVAAAALGDLDHRIPDTTLMPPRSGMTPKENSPRTGTSSTMSSSV